MTLHTNFISVKAEEGESKGQPATLDENDSIWVNKMESEYRSRGLRGGETRSNTFA